MKLAGDHVAEIGKQLTSYEAVSAGLFVIAPSLVDVLAELDQAACGGDRHARRQRRPIELGEHIDQRRRDHEQPGADRLVARELLADLGNAVAGQLHLGRAGRRNHEQPGADRLVARELLANLGNAVAGQLHLGRVIDVEHARQVAIDAQKPAASAAAAYRRDLVNSFSSSSFNKL